MGLVKSKKARLDEDWPIALLNWPTEQGEFILIPFFEEKFLICGYITKSLAKTSGEQLLLKVI
jgi:hypothetical protein